MHKALARDDQILRKVMRAIVPVPSAIYSPSEDSFLMLDALSNVSVQKKEVLDVGAGSGILGLFAALYGADVTLTDISEEALTYAKEASLKIGVTVKTIHSDLFSNVRGRFDLVLFNPPYLPSQGLEDKSVDGGEKGTSLTRTFLHQLEAHLKSDGRALLLLSSQNDPASLIEEHSEFDFAIMSRRPLFFEELQVLSVKPRRSATC